MRVGGRPAGAGLPSWSTRGATESRAAQGIATVRECPLPSRAVLRRLGVNLLYLVPRRVGGTETFARRLVAALAAERPELEIVCFCGREAGAELPDPEWPDRVRTVVLGVQAARKPLRLAAELGQLPRVAARERIDLLHSLGTTTPMHGRFARVTTVHDLIYHHYPASFPAPARVGLELLVPLGARRSDRVQVSSEATREEVVALLRVPRDRIDVVPLGVGMREVTDPTPQAELRARLDLGDRPVLLSVAAALPHKNLDRLLRALAALDGPGAPALVLAGHAGRETERLQALAAELGVHERLRMTGWLSDADLEGAYQLARGFVYPSLHEGFGIPVLEAMQRGTPVASSNATSLPEVAGDAALLFDPRSVDAIAGAMRSLVDDAALREDLVARGRERVAQFGWERTARAALASYDRALTAAASRAGRRR
jgi:glycosyltransferase involved in cell wall biosynthesis